MRGVYGYFLVAGGDTSSKYARAWSLACRTARGARWRRLAGVGQLYDDTIYCLRSVWDLPFLLFYFFGHAD